uniref:Uncharacterized protein n=1 Tax=Anguilla anguilla TaxID=7936 RepID=A0A0E9V8M7_ANGAN
MNTAGGKLTFFLLNHFN